MSERLTVSLEDGRLDKLRELAGGQRKVGVYLSNVVRFLATYEELVTTEDFQDLCIVRRVAIDDLPQQALQEMEANYQGFKRELDARLDALQARLDALRPLPTQEDSGHNDA